MEDWADKVDFYGTLRDLNRTEDPWMLDERDFAKNVNKKKKKKKEKPEK